MKLRTTDLFATGEAELVAGGGSDNYLQDAGAGTSYVAPQVAGAAVLLKDWVYDRGGLRGGLTGNPYALRTLLSVMGDGASTAGSSYVVSPHPASGFGHLRFVDLDNEIGAYGAWGLHSWKVTEGQVIEWAVGSTGPESTAVKGWKFVALWDVNLYGGSPDIKFQLIDKCPSGGGEVVVREALRFPLKARMRMVANDMSHRFHGRCLYVRGDRRTCERHNSALCR